MKKLSVTTEIVILILTMGLMVTAVGIFGIYKISESNASLEVVLKEAFGPFQDLKSISNKLTTIQTDVNHIAENKSSIVQKRKAITDSFAEIEELLGNVETTTANPSELHYLAQLNELISQYNKQINNWLDQSNNQSIESLSQISKLNYLLVESQNNIETLMDILIEKANSIRSTNEEDFNKSKLYFGLILLIGLGVSMIMSLVILIGIKRSIKSITRLIQKIASGNLSTQIEERGNKDFGEVQRGLQILSEKFSNILELSQQAANNITLTSIELNTNAITISDGSNQQAASVEELAASMEQILSTVKENTSNALAAQEISSQLVNDVKLGSTNVTNTVTAIQSIASKISLIGDIAFQTNILALNAAVEAARAGEHGKGFGVVASEVGKLAERSKAAALEINNLSQSGVDLAIKSNQILNQFVIEIEKTTALVSDVTNASLQQNTGINEVNSSIQLLNIIAQQNAASSEEMASVSEQLAAQAHTLKESIQYFKFNNNSVSKGKEQKLLQTRNKAH
ncbi:MAG: MCP four helix bundle domain-containing protein [Bacteroidales bacterium]|nr:MCP four helix bundle domain-containing protein [Bacteroidales bacterium]